MTLVPDRRVRQLPRWQGNVVLSRCKSEKYLHVTAVVWGMSQKARLLFGAALAA